MKQLGDALRDQFTIVNLGCIGDTDYRLPRNIIRALTVVEVDAEGGAQTQNPYHRKIQIAAPIAGVAGKHTFIRNSFAGTCSLLRPRAGKVEAFGMGQYFQEIGTVELDCETLPDMLRREKVATLDFLKTEVEGLASAIIRSCREYLGKTLCVQCELRFSPNRIFMKPLPCWPGTDMKCSTLFILTVGNIKHRIGNGSWKAGRSGLISSSCSDRKNWRKLLGPICRWPSPSRSSCVARWARRTTVNICCSILTGSCRTPGRRSCAR